VHVTVKLTVSSGELVTVLDENVESRKELESLAAILKIARFLEENVEAFLKAKGESVEGQAEG